MPELCATPCRGGMVARGDILAALPFENMPVLAEVLGTVLLDALEHGAAFAEAQGGGLLHTAGLRYGVDIRNPTGKRVIQAEIRTPDGSWGAVIPGGLYRVVSVDYLGRGGDGYGMLTGLRWKEAAMPVNDALAGYLKKHSPLLPRLDGRLTVIR